MRCLMKEVTVEEYFTSKPKSVEDWSQRLLFALSHKEEIDEYLGKVIDEKTNN